MVHNAAKDHILSQYNVSNPRVSNPAEVHATDLKKHFDFDAFCRTAKDSSWISSFSDNCSAQYRTPRHYNQIAQRGFRYGHLSIHTFNAPQHGKQQSDPLGGREHALARNAEKRGERLDSHWRLYEYMVKNHGTCERKRSDKYSVSGPVFRAYVDDAVLDDKHMKTQIEESPEHKSRKSAIFRSTLPCQTPVHQFLPVVISRNLLVFRP